MGDLEAARLSPRGGGGAPRGWAALWEYQAAQSSQSRAEGAQGASWGQGGGHFDRVALPPETVAVMTLSGAAERAHTCVKKSLASLTPAQTPCFPHSCFSKGRSS